MHPRQDTLGIVIHCTGTTPSQDIGVAELDRLARATGYFAIRYHWVIDRYGLVHKGRDEELYAPHTRNLATRHTTIGVILVGGGCEDDPLVREDNFTMAQMAALGELVDEVQGRHDNSLYVSGAVDPKTSVPAEVIEPLAT